MTSPSNYRIHISPRFRRQLRDAPATLRGHVAGVIALLRVDPITPSALPILVDGEDVHTVVFASGRGFLRYEVFPHRRTIVLVDLAWLE